MAAARYLLFLRRRCTPLRTLILLPSLLRRFSSSSCSDSDGPPDPIRLLSEKPSLLSTYPSRSSIPDHVLSAVSALADELLAAPDPAPILESRSAVALLRDSPDGAASIHLLSLLKSRPRLALEVFSWRRKTADPGLPLLPEEYAKAISLAGRARDVELAAGLFSEAMIAADPESCLYNALMSAYMFNGLTKKCIAVYKQLQRDPYCAPTIVTYNVLLSLFGRSLLVDHMEAILHTIDDTGIPRTIDTYNAVIAAYVTAWMWDRMESTFQAMVEGPVKPDSTTLLLTLRGYANAGKLEKMERAYEQVRKQVDWVEAPFIRAMICAYCKNSHPGSIEKIEELMKYVGDEEYRPWLNVLLIRAYAREGLLESMERFIAEAFEKNTVVTAAGVMRSIIASYFRCNSVDRLAGFIRQAEDAGWRLCRSLYHCKMVMYGQQDRLAEMHGVLDEMETLRFGRTKKTFVIMYKAYSKVGRMSEADSVVGMMWKHGLVGPHDAFCS